MKEKGKFRKGLSVLTSVVMCATMVLSSGTMAFAYQTSADNGYVDPASRWAGSENRTGEWDMNALTSTMVAHCDNCGKDEVFTVYRVPEYTSDGKTNLLDTTLNPTRNSTIRSDLKYVSPTQGAGDPLQQVSNKALDYKSPTDGGIYTGYHWTKSTCNVCGCPYGTGKDTAEYNDWKTNGNNFYRLAKCTVDENDVTKYAPVITSVSDTQHQIVTKQTTHCRYCFGTNAATTASSLENHKISETVTPDLGNNQYVVKDNCTVCNYSKTTTKHAEVIGANYAGKADGKDHTITVTNISDNDVNVTVKYGTSADNITLDQAPTFKDEGTYPVYYKVTYNYGGKSATSKAAVNYVTLTQGNHTPGSSTTTDGNHTPGGNTSGGGTTIVVDPSNPGTIIDQGGSTGGNTGSDTGNKGNTGNKDNTGSDTGNTGNTGTTTDQNVTVPHDQYLIVKIDGIEHWCKYVKTIAPTCTTKGYDIYTCVGGDYSYRVNWKDALGHDYETISKVDPTCTEAGTTIQICKRCGNSTITHPAALGHDMEDFSVAPTCTTMGYSGQKCTRCGYQILNGVTEATGHKMVDTVVKPTCDSKGYTKHTCSVCGYSYEDSYVDALGHDYQVEALADSGCTQDGIKVMKCSRCGDEYHEVISKKGHTPGAAATCTEPQICTVCGAVIEKPLGHDYTVKTVAPTCDKMGYDLYTCTRCGDTYKTNYTDPTGHTPSDWIVDKAATLHEEGTQHKECTVCGKTLEVGTIPKLASSATTDANGQAIVGDMLVTVSDEAGKPIDKAQVTIEPDGTITVTLPNGKILKADDPIEVKVDKLNDKGEVENPVKDQPVTVNDKNGNYAGQNTNKDGIATVPDNKTATNSDGKGTVVSDEDTLTVQVIDTDTNKPISGATVKGYDNGGKITVVLPDGRELDGNDQVTVIVTTNKGKAVEGMPVTVRDDMDTQATEKTDKNGSITVPEKSADNTKVDENTKNPAKTDKNGNANITYKDADGESHNLKVRVSDGETGTAVPGATVSVGTTGNITVVLPDGTKLDEDDTIAVKVTDDKNNPQEGRTIIVKNNLGDRETGVTDDNGTVLVPDTTPSTDVTDKKGNGTIGNTDANGDRVVYDVNVEDASGKPIPDADVSINSKGEITVTLPKDADSENVTITVKDHQTGTPGKNVSIVVKGNDASYAGETDSTGKYNTGSSYSHGSHIKYIYGYTNGSFGPGKGITRSEASAMLARLLADANGDSYHPTYALSQFKDIAYDSWYSGYVSYLNSYGILKGYSNGTFKPNEQITRAEFLSLVVRFNDVSKNKVNVQTTAKEIGFSDVPPTYWAYEDIDIAAKAGWIAGYTDGTFRGDSSITRAEAVTILNNMLGRTADTDYINTNRNSLSTYYDVNQGYWAYYDIMEASNGHNYEIKNGIESWTSR